MLRRREVEASYRIGADVRLRRADRPPRDPQRAAPLARARAAPGGRRPPSRSPGSASRRDPAPRRGRHGRDRQALAARRGAARSRPRGVDPRDARAGRPRHRRSRAGQRHGERHRAVPHRRRAARRPPRSGARLAVRDVPHLRPDVAAAGDRAGAGSHIGARPRHRPPRDVGHVARGAVHGGARPSRARCRATTRPTSSTRAAGSSRGRRRTGGAWRRRRSTCSCSCTGSPTTAPTPRSSGLMPPATPRSPDCSARSRVLRVGA